MDNVSTEEGTVPPGAPLAAVQESELPMLQGQPLANLHALQLYERLALSQLLTQQSYELPISHSIWTSHTRDASRTITSGAAMPPRAASSAEHKATVTTGSHSLLENKGVQAFAMVRGARNATASGVATVDRVTR